MKRIAFALATLLAPLLAAQASAVSPPQYRQQRLLAATVGASPFVSVGEVVETGGAYSVDVACARLSIARGVSFLLKKRYDFGGLVLTVRVLDEHGAAVEVDESAIGGDPVAASRGFVVDALVENPLVESFPGSPITPLVVLVRPQVVQFWNDDLADPNGNESLLARDAFASCARETFFSGAVHPVWTTGTVPSPAGRLEGWIPAAAHSDGMYGSRWTTDLLIFGDPGTELELFFLPAERDNNEGQEAYPLHLDQPLTSIPDVLQRLFNTAGHGALRYRADHPVRLAARTWTNVGEGTTGLYTPDLANTDVALGGTAHATLQMGVDRREGFRANLGLVNASDRQVSLLVEVTLGDGTPASSFTPFTVVLPPLGTTQVNDLLAGVSPGERSGLLVRARVLTPGGSAIAFLSEIDNRTSSACYQAAVVR